VLGSSDFAPWARAKEHPSSRSHDARRVFFLIIASYCQMFRLGSLPAITRTWENQSKKIKARGNGVIAGTRAFQSRDEGSRGQHPSFE
jgi:hypothetical protein